MDRPTARPVNRPSTRPTSIADPLNTTWGSLRDEFRAIEEEMRAPQPAPPRAFGRVPREGEIGVRGGFNAPPAGQRTFGGVFQGRVPPGMTPVERERNRRDNIVEELAYRAAQRRLHEQEEVRNEMWAPQTRIYSFLSDTALQNYLEELERDEEEREERQLRHHHDNYYQHHGHHHHEPQRQEHQRRGHQHQRNFFDLFRRRDRR
ncbi:hypothetical protein G7Z17_g7329 [Cylindrodendrum hubeiense]|uniref:Uncharacterized protein n=1 Tax=Cylindrodendrum hubeiense TaxID=595255 RepID=A0A9P5H5P6_9HYPO|nr:hypothetical protein G7Z17_g7329 [Cylindrodendrum hubeiense]